ncbi:MAG: hypothetical protein IMZ64_05130 [Bacteroidetes bacterium]|nr:hypothetical protein [Bacteroidota bacterium]
MEHALFYPCDKEIEYLNLMDCKEFEQIAHVLDVLGKVTEQEEETC